jgi:hypothetical protein
VLIPQAAAKQDRSRFSYNASVIERRAIFLLLLVLSAACRRTSAPAGTDSGVRASPGRPPDAAAATGPSADPGRLRVVATMNTYNGDFETKSSVDLDGTVYVSSGGLAYEARDGSLSLLLPLQAFAVTMPAETTPFVGLENDDDPIAVPVKDAKGQLYLFGEHRGWTASGKTLTKLPASKLTAWKPLAFRGGLVSTEYEKGLSWVGTAKGEGGTIFRVKSDPGRQRKYRDVTVARDGTLVASVSGLPEVAIWPPTAALDAGEIVALAPRPGKDRTRECEVPPAFDGSVYLCCEDIVSETPAPTIHRLDGTRVVDAFVGTPARCSGASIDRDGSLYRVVRTFGSDEPDRIERCGSNGSCVRIEVELPDIRAPHYWLGFDQVRDEKGARWFGLAVEETTKPEKKLWINKIYARAPDDVWAVGAGAIFHNRGRPEAAIALPTRTDARVLAQNERSPIPWTKHCEQVFVELGAGAAVDAGATVDQEKIAAILGKKGPPVEWRLVTGRLYDHDAAGVVVWRDEYDWKREDMDKAIERLVEAFTRDPVNVPKVYCTLPVLSRAFAHPSSP